MFQFGRNQYTKNCFNAANKWDKMFQTFFNEQTKDERMYKIKDGFLKED